MDELNIAKKIASKIRLKRQQLCLSQEELANLSGMHRTYIGAIERGEKRITVATLYKIAKATNESITFFLEGL